MLFTFYMLHNNYIPPIFINNMYLYFRLNLRDVFGLLSKTEYVKELAVGSLYIYIYIIL